MVEFTIYDHTGPFDLSTYLDAATMVTQRLRSGVTDYAFTDSDVYGASMFAIQSAGGTWNGDLFLGHGILLPNGRAGFSPDIRVSGQVAGSPIDAFAVDYFSNGGNPATFGESLLAGNDRIELSQNNGHLAVGQYDAVISTFAGRDTVFADGGLNQVNVGDGNDTVVIKNGYGTYYGDAGRDKFFIQGTSSRDSQYLAVAGGDGRDTFVVNGGGYYGTGIFTGNGHDNIYINKVELFVVINQFSPGEDRIYLNSAEFSALVSGYSQANFVNAPAARDADDYIIYNADNGQLIYDPDGNGAAGGSPVALLVTNDGHAVQHLDWSDVAVADPASHPSVRVGEHIAASTAHAPLSEFSF